MPTSPGYIPGPLVIPDTFELRLGWTQPNGKKTSNVLHFTATGSVFPSPATPQAIYDLIVGDAAWTAYAATLSIDCNFDTVEIKDLRTANQPFISSSVGVNPGTDASHALPEGLALVVSLGTALSGRAHRGRVYLSGFTVDSADTVGHAASGTVGAAQAFVQLISDTINGVDPFWLMGVAHRGHASYVSPFSGLTIPAEAAGTDPVTDITVKDNVFDSQRRRK